MKAQNPEQRAFRVRGFMLYLSNTKGSEKPCLQTLSSCSHREMPSLFDHGSLLLKPSSTLGYKLERHCFHDVCFQGTCHMSQSDPTETTRLQCLASFSHGPCPCRNWRNLSFHLSMASSVKCTFFGKKLRKRTLTSIRSRAHMYLPTCTYIQTCELVNTHAHTVSFLLNFWDS